MFSINDMLMCKLVPMPGVSIRGEAAVRGLPFSLREKFRGAI